MIIPVKFGQNPISGLGGDVFLKISDERTDIRSTTTDGDDSQKLNLSLRLR